MGKRGGEVAKGAASDGGRNAESWGAVLINVIKKRAVATKMSRPPETPAELGKNHALSSKCQQRASAYPIRVVRARGMRAWYADRLRDLPTRIAYVDCPRAKVRG